MQRKRTSSKRKNTLKQEMKLEIYILFISKGNKLFFGLYENMYLLRVNVLLS